MSGLVGFLLAGIAEDETNAKHYLDIFPDGDMAPLFRRVLAECEAKRRIIALHQPSGGPNYRGTECCARCTAGGEYPADDGYTDEQNWPCPTLRALALPYAEHPDYREEWRP